MSNGILRIADREISYEEAKGMLFPELIPQKGNAEVLAEHPHDKVEDMTVVYEIAGAPFDLYIKTQFDSLAPEDWETEVYFPIRKKM